MGYFVALVPNTALAKEAGEPRWSQGWVYLRDFVDPYALWLPLLVLLAFVIRDARRAAALRRPAIFVALVAPVGAAALHALYVARVGGDFMHGRFLLPTLFGLILPAATVCVRLPEASARRAVATGVAAAGIAAWALVAAVWLRVPYQQTNGPDGIADERGVYVENSGHPHPVTLADYMGMRQTWPRDGATWRARATHAPRVLVVDGQELPLAGWVDPSAGIAAMAHNVGLAGVAAGRRVHVVDTYGLADPLAGRLLLSERGRPGHEKRLPVAWVIARFSEPTAGEPADVASARRVLACDEPARLHDAVTGPLTFGRFLRNLRDAWSFHDLRIPDDPATAERQLCEPA
jgi:arabinofuranosyltransferase